jgi:hypothetical protein
VLILSFSQSAISMIIFLDLSDVYIINKIIHGRLEIWIYLLVFKILLRSLVRYQAWTLEDKFHISVCPCIIFYLLYGKVILWSTIGQFVVCNFPYGPKRFSIAFNIAEKLPYNKHLINLVCLVCTISHGFSFFPLFYGLHTTHLSHKAVEKTWSITYGTDLTLS